MTYEEAKKALCHMMFCLGRRNCKHFMYEALQKAIESLEKQIPKSWIMKTNFIEETIWECPSCNEEFVLTEGDVNDNSYYYCPNCGQALDWSE